MNQTGIATRHRLLLVLGLVIFATSAAYAQTQTVVGLSPEAASRIPGVPHLFQIRNASGPPQIRPGEKFKLGEVIARFPLSMSDEEIEQLAKLSGALRVTRTGPFGLFLIEGPPSARATQELMDRLWETRATVNLTANYLSGTLTAVFSPDDPQHVNGNQWYIEQPSDIDLDLTKVWGEITRGSEEVVVAQTDSGIDVDHFEFLNRLFVNPGEIPGNGFDDDNNGYKDDVSGWNTISVPPSNDVNDTDAGHGTWVAGILLANADNAFQVAGIDHRAKLLPLKMADGSSLPAQELSALIAALEYLVANPTSRRSST